MPVRFLARVTGSVLLAGIAIILGFSGLPSKWWSDYSNKNFDINIGVWTYDAEVENLGSGLIIRDGTVDCDFFELQHCPELKICRILGVLSVAISVIVFGSSWTFRQALNYRPDRAPRIGNITAILGLASGLAGVVSSFSWFSLISNVSEVKTQLGKMKVNLVLSDSWGAFFTFSLIELILAAIFYYVCYEMRYSEPNPDIKSDEKLLVGHVED